MDWFLVVYFLVGGTWVDADKLEKEGWSPIIQPNYKICIEKMNETNERFIKIANYRDIELDIKFKCECKLNEEKPNIINCKKRNWFQKIYDKFFLINN